MALFFRKRIKILPGVTLNLSKSGVSATVGRKGASVSVGKRGTYLNAGQPGTGIYSRTRLDKPAGRRRSAGKANAEIEAPEQTDPVTESAAAPEAPPVRQAVLSPPSRFSSASRSSPSSASALRASGAFSPTESRPTRFRHHFLLAVIINSRSRHGIVKSNS